jgi:hypothetical protein
MMVRIGAEADGPPQAPAALAYHPTPAVKTAVGGGLPSAGSVDNDARKGGQERMTVEVLPLTIDEIEERLSSFEKRFEMPSDYFTLAFRNGRLAETEEFREWSMLISARRVLTAK